MRDVQIIQHSLGVDQHGQGDQYRNHFVTGEGSKDWDACLDLVKRGLMARRKGSPLTGGDDLFLVTEAGKTYMTEHSPKPPKVSRAKARYQRYLEYSDCFDSFRDFLGWDGAPERSWNARPTPSEQL